MTQTAPVAPVAPVAPASASAPAPIQAAPEHKGWSWGALMLGPMFLIGIKKYIYLLLYLLFLIPLVNIVVFFAIPIYLGIKGRTLAYASTMFKTEAEADGFMRGIDHAGKVLFFVTIIIYAVMIVFYITLWATLFSHMPSSQNQFYRVAPTAFPTAY